MAQLDYLSGTILRDATGAPYLGAKASYWADVGATTPLTTYSDAGLSSANANPVVSDGTTGAFGAIYLQAKRYWRTVTTSASVALTQFNSGPIDGFVTLVESATAPSPSYKLMYWYDTTAGKLKRRDSTNSSWLDFGGIDSLINAATVTDQLTGTSTSLASTPDSVAGLWQRGTDIASAATLSLPATGGGVYNITGTTGITGISSAQGGRSVKLRFAGACTLTHNASSFILPGAANLTTAAGDTFEFINEAAADASGSNWRCFNYALASGGPITLSTALTATQANQETATSTLLAVTPGRQQFHPSAAKCWGYITWSGGVPTLQVNWNITSITDTATGIVTITIATDFSTANYATTFGVEGTGGNQNFVQVNPTTQAAGSFAVLIETSVGTDYDPASMSFACFGDQP